MREKIKGVFFWNSQANFCFKVILINSYLVMIFARIWFLSHRDLGEVETFTRKPGAKSI